MNKDKVSVHSQVRGQSSDYIIGRLNQYKNRETVGAMSLDKQVCYQQDIKLLGEYIEETYKGLRYGVNRPYCVNQPYEQGYEYKYYMLDEDFTREELFEIFPTARTPQIKLMTLVD